LPVEIFAVKVAAEAEPHFFIITVGQLGGMRIFLSTLSVTG
jgi:hypothetical protein